MGTKGFAFMGTGFVSLALAACLIAPALAQDQQQAPPDQPAADQQQPPPGDAAPPPAEAPPPQGDVGPPPSSQAAPPVNQPVAPATLTLPAGTVISVRVMQQLSSDRNQVGDRFSASLEQPLIANGWVVARRGQIATGRVVVADKGAHGGPSKLGVQIIELTLVDGQILPVDTQFTQSSAPRGRDTSRDVSTVATTTVIGTMIGAIAGGGTGAAIGAGLGATTGTAVVLSTKGAPTRISSEQLLTFRLQTPLAIATEEGQVAFQPVRQSDYSRPDQDAYAQPQLSRRPPPPYGGPAYYTPYGYPYPYWYGWGYYPFVPYVGFYGYYGGFYGPGFYGGGFRGFRR